MAPINNSDDDDDDDDDGVVGSGMWLPLMTVDPTWGGFPSISSITLELECANTKHQILINAGRPHVCMTSSPGRQLDFLLGIIFYTANIKIQCQIYLKATFL